MIQPRESSHCRRARREVQDATALRTIVLAAEETARAYAASEPADPLAVEIVRALHQGWVNGTLTDRIRLPATDPLVPRAERIGFTWGRGERFRNRRSERQHSPLPSTHEA